MAATIYELFFGSANAGGAPTWTRFADASTNADLSPHPVFTDLGGGLYSFSWDWTLLPDTTSISYIASLNGLDLFDVLYSNGQTASGGVTPPPVPDGVGKMSLANIRTEAKQRADMVASSFVTDDEWNRYINGSALWLYGILSTKFEDYNVSTATLTTNGTEFLSLPSDFMKLRGVDLQAPGTPTGWVSLRPFTVGERNRTRLPWPTVYAVQASEIRYRVRGDQLWFAPTPPTGRTVRVLYTPRLVPLALDTDNLDGVNGWEQLVILDAARKALLKEESDTSGVEREIAVLVQRIEGESQNRDAGEAATVTDIQRGGFDFPDPFWWP